MQRQQCHHVLRPQHLRRRPPYAGSARCRLPADLIIGFVNLVFTFVAILCVDRFEWRPLLIAGSAVEVLALSATRLAMATGQGGTLLLVPILVFFAAYACAMGPGPWIVVSAIFPAGVWEAAIAVATAALWSACCLVAQTFPDLCTKVGIPGACDRDIIR